MTYYRPKYFQLYELIPHEWYGTIKASDSILWSLLDARVLYTADRLRERHGKATINNWYWDGHLNYRGWRPFDCGIGAAFSQHKFGRALDMTFENSTPEEVRGDIINGCDKEHGKYVTCIEADVPWVHFDVGNRTRKILIVRSK